jgi:type I restriction enzyme S subunit
LQGVISKFSLLSDKAKSAIELMHERRTALISAAVTGKIDVRNWQPNTSTQAAEPDLPLAAEQAGRYHV